MSPCSNRGDIIEEKWGKEKEPRTKENGKRKKRRRKVNKVKSPNAASSCHQTRDMSRKEKILSRCSVRCCTRGWGVASSRWQRGVFIFAAGFWRCWRATPTSGERAGQSMFWVRSKAGGNWVDLQDPQKYRFHQLRHWARHTTACPWAWWAEAVE